jgi:hypothetical protein
VKPDRVLSVYAKHGEEVAPPEPPGKLGRVERGLAASRVRDNQKFLLVAAAVILVALIGFGLVSRNGAPPAGAITTPTFVPASGVASPASGVTVVVTATAPVQVNAVIDGVAQDPTTLRPGESVSLIATEQLQVSADDGGAIQLTVNGHDTGTPGHGGKPWSQTFTPEAASP